MIDRAELWVQTNSTRIGDAGLALDGASVMVCPGLLTG